MSCSAQAKLSTQLYEWFYIPRTPTIRFVVACAWAHVVIVALRVEIRVIAVVDGLVGGTRSADGVTARCWQEPVAVPAPQEYFDVCGEAKVLDVAGEALPVDAAVVERVFEVVCGARVHPVEEWLDGGRVWDGEEDDGMGGRGGQQTGEAEAGDAGGEAGAVGGRDAGKEGSEEDGLGGETAGVELVGGERGAGGEGEGDAHGG